VKFKIIVDSSSNLTSNYLKDEKDIGFAVAPLIVRINQIEYVDDDNVDVDKILKEMSSTREKATSSCPPPSEYHKQYSGAEYYFVYTISQKLSGSYNSAIVARDMFDNNENIFVLDSKLTSGAIELLVIKTVELIKKGLSFEQIKKEVTEYKDSLNLFFVLDKFDNLVKNGRMSKAVAFIAQLANIKPLCFGDDGEIKIKEKIRTIHGVLKRLVANIRVVCKNTSDRVLIISHTKCKETAELLKTMIQENYDFKEIIISENRGLCAFYSLEGGIICSF